MCCYGHFDWLKYSLLSLIVYCITRQNISPFNIAKSGYFAIDITVAHKWTHTHTLRIQFTATYQNLDIKICKLWDKIVYGGCWSVWEDNGNGISMLYFWLVTLFLVAIWQESEKKHGQFIIQLPTATLLLPFFIFCFLLF